MSKGFSLVELSIVLVILGLLTGGILSGQSLIRASELRSVATEASGHQTTIMSFRDKYFNLPGDMSIASRFWTGAPDGNKNGVIEYNGGAAAEEYTAWQHLGLSGLLGGDFTGGLTSLPKGKLSNSRWRLSNQTNVYGKNGLMLSLNSPNGTGLANKPILTPGEVYNIDAKMDDGQADKGNVMGFNEQGVPGCVTNDYTAGSGSYILDNEAIRCKVFFVFSR